VVEPTPLKNDGVRQLGWIDIPKIWKVIKFRGSKAPTRKVVNLGFTVLAWMDYEFLKSHWLTVVDQKKGGW
jgi:hypothetical protein